MTVYQGKSRKKFTGGKLHSKRSNRRFEAGREPTLTRLGDDSRKVLRTYGGNQKATLMRGNQISVYDPKSGSTKFTKIITVKENPANPHYVQRNIMNRGTVVETELGMARITSRPGQSGTISSVLV